MNQDGDGLNGENPADAFKFTFTVGVNDLIDYVRDIYTNILGREPTAARLAATNVKSMDSARAIALTTAAKELLMTFNSNEARKGLVDRLFRTVGGANLEIGNLLPTGYTLLPADRDGLVAKLVNGTTTPERLIVEIMTGMASTTAASAIPGLGQTYYNNAVGALTGQAAARAYLTQVYKDVFRLNPTTSRLDFSWLPAATPAQQVHPGGHPGRAVHLRERPGPDAEGRPVLRGRGGRGGQPEDHLRPGLDHPAGVRQVPEPDDRPGDVEPAGHLGGDHRRAEPAGRPPGSQPAPDA